MIAKKTDVNIALKGAGIPIFGESSALPVLSIKQGCINPKDTC